MPIDPKVRIAAPTVRLSTTTPAPAVKPQVATLPLPSPAGFATGSTFEGKPGVIKRDGIFYLPWPSSNRGVRTCLKQCFGEDWAA